MLPLSLNFKHAHACIQAAATVTYIIGRARKRDRAPFHTCNERGEWGRENLPEIFIWPSCVPVKLFRAARFASMNVDVEGFGHVTGGFYFIIRIIRTLL